MTHAPRTPPILPGLVFTLALAGCSPTGIDMTNAAPSSDAPARVVASEFRHNPQPRQAHRLTVKIDGAPGPFSQLLAMAQFDVANKECLPPPDANPGGYTSAVPTEDVEIPLTRVSDTEYQGTFYVDQMLDEDYYGRGVCRWELVEARLKMKASGAESETLFIPHAPRAALLAGEPQVNYFNKNTYPAVEMPNYPDIGTLDRTQFGPSIRDSDLFTITLATQPGAAP